MDALGARTTTPRTVACLHGKTLNWPLLPDGECRARKDRRTKERGVLRARKQRRPNSKMPFGRRPECERRETNNLKTDAAEVGGNHMAFPGQRPRA